MLEAMSPVTQGRRAVELLFGLIIDINSTAGWHGTSVHRKGGVGIHLNLMISHQDSGAIFRH